MKKTGKLVGLFASSVVVAPLAGCDGGEEVDICFDVNNDRRCDDSNEFVNSDDYLVINGKKTRIYITDDSFIKGDFGDDGGYGG